MSAAFDPFHRVVYNMMSRFGGDSELVRTFPDGVYNPETSEMEVVEFTYPVRTIVFDYIPKFNGDTTQSNTLIRSGDKQMYIKPGEFPPPEADTDKIVYMGINYKIVTVKAVCTNGIEPVLYELFLRN